MSPLLVSIIFMVQCLHAERENLDIRIPVYIIIISIPVSDDCVLIVQAPVMSVFYNVKHGRF